MRTEAAVALELGQLVRSCVRLGQLMYTAEEKARLEELANEHTADESQPSRFPGEPPFDPHPQRHARPGASRTLERIEAECERTMAEARKMRPGPAFATTLADGFVRIRELVSNSKAGGA